MRRELNDNETEQLLSGRKGVEDSDVSSFIEQLRGTYRVKATTPVGAALAEFVDVQSTVDDEAIQLPAMPGIDLTTTESGPQPRRTNTMWKKLSATAAVAIAGVALLGSIASAGSTLDDGEYTLNLPGVGEFEFTIDSGATDTDTIVAVAAPEGYGIDDDDPAKVAWKNAASLEVEIKTDKIESDYDWVGGDAQLSFDGGLITVSKPDADGNFLVTASGD